MGPHRPIIPGQLYNCTVPVVYPYVNMIIEVSTIAEVTTARAVVADASDAAGAGRRRSYKASDHGMACQHPVGDYGLCEGKMSIGPINC